MRDITDRENQNTYCMLINSFPKIVLFKRLCEKYYTAGQVAGDNMAQAYYVLYN
jgi:hypothetical protein